MCQLLTTFTHSALPREPIRRHLALEKGESHVPPEVLTLPEYQSHRGLHIGYYSGSSSFNRISGCRDQSSTFSKTSLWSCLAGCKCCLGELSSDHLPTSEVPLISHRGVLTSPTKSQWPMRLSPNYLLYINVLTLSFTAGNKKVGWGWASNTKKEEGFDHFLSLCLNFPHEEQKSFS